MAQEELTMCASWFTFSSSTSSSSIPQLCSTLMKPWSQRMMTCSSSQRRQSPRRRRKKRTTRTSMICSASVATRSTMTTRSCTAWTASTQVSPPCALILSHVCAEATATAATAAAAAAWSIENCRTGCYPGCRRRHSGVPYTCAAGVVSSGGGARAGGLTTF